MAPRKGTRRSPHFGVVSDCYRHLRRYSRFAYLCVCFSVMFGCLFTPAVLASSGDIGHYYYGPGHPMKPHRLKLAHHLILSYNLYREMDVYRPHLATSAVSFFVRGFFLFFPHSHYMIHTVPHCFFECFPFFFFYPENNTNGVTSQHEYSYGSWDCNTMV